MQAYATGVCGTGCARMRKSSWTRKFETIEESSWGKGCVRNAKLSLLRIPTRIHRKTLQSMQKNCERDNAGARTARPHAGHCVSAVPQTLQAISPADARDGRGRLQDHFAQLRLTFDVCKTFGVYAVSHDRLPN